MYTSVPSITIDPLWSPVDTAVAITFELVRAEPQVLHESP